MEGKKDRKKINHSLEELQDGVILTIQDKPILEGNEINENIDTFENYDIRRENQIQHNNEIKDKIKTLSNAASSHLEAKLQGTGGLLPHYDDYSYKGNEIQIQNGRVLRQKRQKAPKVIGNDFQEPKHNTNSQYYFNKKRNKKIQKSKTSQLLKFLNQTAEEKEVDLPQKSAESIIEESLSVVRKRRKTEKQSRQALEDIISMEEEEMLTSAKEKFRQKNKQTRILDIIKEEEDDHENHYNELELEPVRFKIEDEQNKHQTYEIKDAAKGITSCLNVNLPSQKLIHKKKEEDEPQSFKDISPEQLKKMQEQIRFLQEKQLGTGLAGTLKYLKQNNLLRRQQQFGRSKDKELDINKTGDRVILQYRNASGQLMKPKEAFRYQSAIFHGSGSGKNKIEKVLRKNIQEMKAKETTNEGGKLLKLLEKSQEETGQAHLVLQFGNKRKQQ